MSNFEIFTGIFGGLGLFLYGMKLMGDGLENVAGEGLKGILEKITSNRLMGVFVGTIVTAIIQSSSATTVMVVSFVNAGLMSLTQATGVILGSNIGTTITAQMVSFKLEVVAPIFIGVGAILMMAAKKKKTKELAVISVGFGILFMGMGMMSSSMEPISELQAFKDFILVVGTNPLLGVFVGVVMTAVLQSSSATTAILVALATAGTIDMKVAFPMVLGCNIGTCVTAIIASLTANRTAKKAALIHLLFKIFGTILFLPFVSQVVKIVAHMTPDNLGRQVANAHTIFNIVITVVMLPVSTYVVKLVDRMLPEKDDEIEIQGAIYLDKNLLETPVVASAQVVKETIRMAKKAKENFELAMNTFFNDKEENIEKIYENENTINILEKDITEYLVELSEQNLPEENAKLVSQIYHTINDLERIGDHSENIAELALEKCNKKIEMSEDAIDEVKEMFETTLRALDLAIENYENHESINENIAEEMEEKIDELEVKFRENNIKRLSSKMCLADSGVMFFDLLSNIERIGDHANNIATIKAGKQHKAYA